MTRQRQYTRCDRLIMGISTALDTLLAPPAPGRAYPATSAESPRMNRQNRQQSGRYMRVNHVGEICAQALYQSQALTAGDETTREQMQHAAREEIDHLAWCERRIAELGARKSLLNPLWYAGAFAVGSAAGVAGDKWNLGFVAETERQVVAHLEAHLGRLAEHDLRSREVVEQMQQDEAKHARQAIAAGAAELPAVAKRLMRFAAKIMTKTAYWL